MKTDKDRWDKVKIIFEIFGILISLCIFGFAVVTYYNNLRIDKSAMLYKDFVIEGIIPLQLKIAKMMRAHFSFQSDSGRKRYLAITKYIPKKRLSVI